MRSIRLVALYSLLAIVLSRPAHQVNPLQSCAHGWFIAVATVKVWLSFRRNVNTLSVERRVFQKAPTNGALRAHVAAQGSTVAGAVIEWATSRRESRKSARVGKKYKKLPAGPHARESGQWRRLLAWPQKASVSCGDNSPHDTREAILQI
jgi:hypothetical protein